MEKLNTAKQVTATLTPPTVNMMLNNYRCFVCGKTGDIGCHCPMCNVITVMAFATLHRTTQRKFPHQDHHATMADCDPDHAMTTATGTDHSPFITYVAREYALTSQGHTTDLITAEATATTKGMDPGLHPTITAAHDNHPLTDALSVTITRAHCTSTVTPHP